MHLYLQPACKRALDAAADGRDQACRRLRPWSLAQTAVTSALLPADVLIEGVSQLQVRKSNTPPARSKHSCLQPAGKRALRT